MKSLIKKKGGAKKIKTKRKHKGKKDANSQKNLEEVEKVKENN